LHKKFYVDDLLFAISANFQIYKSRVKYLADCRFWISWS